MEEEPFLIALGWTLFAVLCAVIAVVGVMSIN